MQVTTVNNRAGERANPPVRYRGGKRLLAKTIIEKIGKIPHVCYAEPFFGMGGVFFRRNEVAKCEVINDISKDVTTFLRILQRHYVEFLNFMRWHITTRCEFERLINLDVNYLTDLERAARFFYLQKTAFGAKIAGRHYGYSAVEGGRFCISKMESNLEAVHERLTSVQIENLDYADFIARYDRKETLFYIDPPYWNCENDYGKGIFSKNDFERLAEQLLSVKGKFILSINDTKEIREIFKGFKLEEVKTTYPIGRSGSKKASELLIAK